VVWINCAIPVLVSDEVRRVGESITEVVAHLCSESAVESRFFLNAPDYLFVSTNVAKKFPYLMESILVQAYNNHVPGELARKWQTGSIARMHRRNRRRQFTVFGLFLRTLQYIGTAPFVIHRMFIRFLQPFVFSGLLLLWQLIVSNVIYIAIAVFCVLVILAYGLYRRYQEQVLMEKTQNITPVAAAATSTDYFSTKSDAAYDDDRIIDVHIPNLTALTTNRNHSSVGSSWEEKDIDTEDDGSETVPRRQRRHPRSESHRQTSSDDPEERSSTESSRGHTRGRKSHSPTPRDFANRRSISNSDLSSLDLSTSIHAAPVPLTIGGSPRTVSGTAGYGSKVSPRQRVTLARGVYSSSSSEEEIEVSVSDDSLCSSEGEESRL